ncbi:MAG: hypothetical protein RL094_90 [Candidatus Parcubacteria bacterium]|jgi:uncharacterized protein YpmS
MTDLKDKLKHIYVFGKFAEKDWRRVLILCFCLSIILIVWSTLFFLHVQSATDSVNLVIGSTKTLSGRTKGDELKELVSRYEQKADTFKRIYGSSLIPKSSSTLTASSSANSNATTSSSSVDRAR